MSFATTEWVQKELGTIRGLVDDNTDDFSYAARRDLEWINEHMDDVLDTRFSLSTLLQTPGRLKGAPSPRKARLMARAPQSGPLSPKSMNSMNSGFRKAVARELEYSSRMHNRDSRPKDRSVIGTNTTASASAVTIFSDASPDASFHSAEDVTETTNAANNDIDTNNNSNQVSENTTEHTEHIFTDAPTQQVESPKLQVHELPIPPQVEPESEFTFTSLPPREPLTAKTPGSATVKPSATSLRVQRIRQHLQRSTGAKFSSMIIDGDDDFTKSAAIGEVEPEEKSVAATAAPIATAHVAAPAQNARQLNSPIKLRNPHTGSPSKNGPLYPPISPSKNNGMKENSGHFFSGAIRRAKMLLFQDDKKENIPQHPQTPKQPSANISRLMAPTASSSARSPTRSPNKSPSKLYPEIRSPTKIPEPRQPASPTRIASPVRVASGASSVISLDLDAPMVLRQPSVKASTNSRSSRVPVPKAAERFTRRQAEIRAKEQEAKEKEERAAVEREKEQLEMRELARQERERKEAAAVAEREQQRLVAAAEEQRRRQIAAEKEAELERERKERAERAQRARRERLLRERQERLEKERLEKEEKEEKERLEREEKEKEERAEQERLERERLEMVRIQEELLEEARLESVRLEKENMLRQQQQQQQQSRKRSSSVADEEQQQSQKVHLSNMRKPLSSSTRVSQNHRVSSSIMDSPLNKPTGGSLMRQSLQRQYKTGQMGQMAQSRFGKAVEGVMISNDTIKFGSSSTTTTVTSSSTAAASAAAVASAPPTITSGAGAATPLKRVGPNRPLHTTPQQFRSQRTGAFSSSMSFQAKLFKQPASSTAPTPVASSMGSTIVSDPITPAASHVPVTQLPEINSDSEDDEGDGILRDWANSPELRSLLLRQQVMDPDRIFGPLPPLQMEEIFGNSNNARAAKFRGRSSSANWSRDQLSQFEIDSYSEQMGYK
ncbi:Inner centromere protein-related protein [Yarrowia sp. C11]|nr:Inner centromere protein-related protein [Yarrowia sp. C11]KAG5364502.1 Inner centromere protein-related protein [Yarrowia sp. E02]